MVFNQPPAAQPPPVDYAAQDAEDIELLYLHSIPVRRDQNGEYQEFVPDDPDPRDQNRVYQEFARVDPVQLNEGQYYWHVLSKLPNDPANVDARMVMTKAERIDKKQDGTPEYIFTESKDRTGTAHKIMPVHRFYVGNAGIPDEWRAAKEAEKRRLALQRGLPPDANDDDVPMEQPRGQQAGRKRRTTRRGSKAARKTRGKRIRRRSLKRK